MTRAVVDEAHRHNVKVAIHSRGSTSTRAAAKAGIDLIYHGDWASEADLDAKVALLTKAWGDAGRDGRPRVTVLAGRPDPAVLAHWAEIGVTDVAFGMPDRAEAEVVAYLGRLADKLGLAASAERLRSTEAGHHQPD